nr:kazal domain protein [Cytophagales bacterium]
MKKVVLLYIMLLLTGFSCEDQLLEKETPGTCIDPEKINPDAVCTMEYRPVCGCNNVTYGNSCIASSAGIKSWTAGECP